MDQRTKFQGLDPRWNWPVDWPLGAEMRIRISCLDADAKVRGKEEALRFAFKTPTHLHLWELGQQNRFLFKLFWIAFFFLRFDPFFFQKVMVSPTGICLLQRPDCLATAEVAIMAHLRRSPWEGELVYCRAVCRLKQRSLRVPHGRNGGKTS